MHTSYRYSDTEIIHNIFVLTITVRNFVSFTDPLHCSYRDLSTFITAVVSTDKQSRHQFQQTQVTTHLTIVLGSHEWLMRLAAGKMAIASLTCLWVSTLPLISDLALLFDPSSLVMLVTACKLQRICIKWCRSNFSMRSLLLQESNRLSLSSAVLHSDNSVSVSCLSIFVLATRTSLESAPASCWMIWYWILYF